MMPSGQTIAMDDLWPEDTDPASGDVTLFTITTELVDHDKRDLADSNFQVPAGWKKVEGTRW